MGTPRYMAPEQVTGEALDARSDLFAVGAILFEMLAGRPAFGGRNAVEILHATLYEQPPALTGSPAVAAADRVIRRALAKRPADRPASADAMAEELRAVRGMDGDDTPALARALTRLVVLPFRVLRPDPETDFLAFSLPDAIATSLSAHRLARRALERHRRALRRRGARPQGPRRGGRRRPGRDGNARCAPATSCGPRRSSSRRRAGRCSRRTRSSRRWATCSALQDDIARRVVEALALPLGGGGDVAHARRRRATPAPTSSTCAPTSWPARYGQLAAARDLYERCLELDPAFAPAWAQLGRCHRVIGKYIDGAADSDGRARRRPSAAPSSSTRGCPWPTSSTRTSRRRPASRERALVRLLGEANRHGNDPELFAGLVHACRYCGLFEQSIAAHDEARRLDPNVPTSLEQTLLMTGDIERLLASGAAADRRRRRRRDPRHRPRAGRAPRRGAAGRSLSMRTGRAHSGLPVVDRLPAGLARSAARGHARRRLGPAGRSRSWRTRRPSSRRAGCSATSASTSGGSTTCGARWPRATRVAPTLADSRQFDALRGDPAFQELLAEAEAGRQQALAAFRERGGERLLGR